MKIIFDILLMIKSITILEFITTIIIEKFDIKLLLLIDILLIDY